MRFNAHDPDTSPLAAIGCGSAGCGGRGTVRNSVRWATMMKRSESSHGYRERTSGPAPGWT
ncbi:hypothetical protein CN192_27065 [Sinorhizobium medicae]|nr:hypothetical protein CN192_27065 [Sinorhizobium medicae]